MTGRRRLAPPTPPRPGGRVTRPGEVMDGLVIGISTDPEGHMIGVTDMP